MKLIRDGVVLMAVLTGCQLGPAKTMDLPQDLTSVQPTTTSSDDAGVPSATERTRVLSDDTTAVVLSLTAQTVRCNALGYGVEELKISVPDLDVLAHFDHRVESEGTPCMTAGACSETLTPASLIDSSRPLEVAQIRVVLTETVVLYPEHETCGRDLVETVTTTVRGLAFSHERSGSLPNTDWATCQQLMKL